MRSISPFFGSLAGNRRALTLMGALSALLVVAVLAGSCGGGTTASTSSAGPTAGPPSGGGAQIVMKNLAFNTATVTIKVGESVTWTNQDSANHTVVADNGEFKSGDLANGATFTFKFETAGTYAYHCSIHPSMKATVVVQ
jgi:plastocyanin